MLQVYTGSGKGKTTAAIGLAVRALGAGMDIYIMQFMKGLAYSEQKILRGFSPNLRLETTGKPFFIAEEGMMTEEDRAAWGDGVVVFPPGQPPEDYVKIITEGVRAASREINTGNYGLAILDELNVALFFGLVSREDAQALLNSAPAETEIIVTGRNAPKWLTDRADLVTEMREIRHYYTRGIQARHGIEN